MRVVIFLALLALIITIVVLVMSVSMINSFGSYVRAGVYSMGNRYYLSLNVTNPLPLPIILAIVQGNESMQVVIQPYGHGNVDFPLVSLEIPLRVMIEVPGVFNATYVVTLNEG
ncbi:MAG: hypothetical protein TU36_000715 [Vulcanisaeta sp. AZ3]